MTGIVYKLLFIYKWFNSADLNCDSFVVRKIFYVSFSANDEQLHHFAFHL